jgi:hypothetical protein
VLGDVFTRFDLFRLRKSPAILVNQAYLLVKAVRPWEISRTQTL